uniref:Uncharacterized protein n=1 Tax=Tanacetum cinerariifolium TaxID=118510 RepID=A0A699XD21_TANCI|nr:hypothetical protein [Tanacetum cinerariifolium]
MPVDVSAVVELCVQLGNQLAQRPAGVQSVQRNAADQQLYVLGCGVDNLNRHGVVQNGTIAPHGQKRTFNYAAQFKVGECACNH